MNNTPANSLQRPSLFTLAGVTRIEEKDGQVAGGWSDELRWSSFAGSTRPAEEFANCLPRPESIVRFTRKYGPLHVEPLSGEEFQFQLDDWLSVQAGFRELWRVVSLGLARGS